MPISQPKKTNVEIWSVIPPSSRSRDRGIQDIQAITAASASLILQAASHINIKISCSCIKKRRRKNWHHASSYKNQRCPFSCRESKSRIMNQFMRNMIKPYLPPQFVKLVDISDDSKNFLFGDSTADYIGNIHQ